MLLTLASWNHGNCDRKRLTSSFSGRSQFQEVFKARHTPGCGARHPPAAKQGDNITLLRDARGDSPSYALRRLKRDLAAKVTAGAGAAGERQSGLGPRIAGAAGLSCSSLPFW